MRRNEFLFHAIFASLLFVLAPVASAAPNFSGNWKINAAKTDVGPLPAPEKYEQKIDHKDPSLKYTINQANQMGEFTSDHVYSTDGAECTNKIRGNEIKSKVSWYNVLYTVLAPISPLLVRYLPQYVTTTRVMARAMLKVARDGYDKRVLESVDINAI